MLWPCALLPPLAALLQLGGPASSPAGPAAAANLRVLTWNIQGCAGGLEAVLDDLRRHNADIICLQEAEVGTEHVAGADQAALIAKRLDFHAVSAGSAFARGGEQRMAILARQPLQNPEPLDAGTGRIYGITALARFDGQPIRVVCIHLTNSYWRGFKHALSDSSAPVGESADLARRLKAWSEPVILAGDFNAVPGMREHNLIAGRLTRVPSTQPTFPANRPVLAVDHIYCSTDLRPAQLRTAVSRASDHRPLIADLRAARAPGTAPSR